MLYKKNKSNQLDTALFKKPTCEYRGTPFWSWNCKLTPEILTKQIEYLKEMGLGGFHMHSRTGMATPYLTDEFMDLVKICVKKAEDEEMLAWLYDEDRWPSGSAGGLVTKDPKYRIRELIFTPNEISGDLDFEASIEKGAPYLVACYDIKLNDAGELIYYKKIDRNENAVGDKWFAFSCTGVPNPWYNNQTYVNTLSKEAIDKFIEYTYEGYKKAIGDKFGKSVPAIFTDEPQFRHKGTLNFAHDKKEIPLPWSPDVPETFLRAYGFDLLSKLPELIWELPDNKISKARYLYHDHIAERFASAFADNCGSWCEKNNLMLTGHMMEEPTLFSQTAALGDTMRSYRSFQLPGIDMLCNNVELTTAKQAQSASHQYGREGVLSELYGVTNWDFDFRGHKFQGDWQAALGVTVRVQHLSWVSMAGEAKRDYPASISYQSPWYKEYPYVEDHFSRLNTALTRGKPVVKVGVIHPVESYWLHWGPKENTNAIRQQLDNNFKNITNWLLFGQVDFDFICESLLPDLYKGPSKTFEIGKMNYDTVIVPGCETLRRTTLNSLHEFKNAGGRLIFLGDCPKYIDAEISDEAKALYDSSEKAGFDEVSVLNILKDEKLLDIRNSDGTLTDNLIYNMREDNDCRWLFIAHGTVTSFVDAVNPQDIVLRIKGGFTPILYNTINGETEKIPYRIQNGYTIINTSLNCHDSLLLKLDSKSDNNYSIAEPDKKLKTVIDIKEKVSYSLEEPNVLLLDTAEYSFNGGEFYPAEEILRLDNIFREKLGWPLKMDAVAQPWVIEEEPVQNYLTLRFTILSEINVDSPLLAVEDANQLVITLNDEIISPEITGYFVDESIKTVKLPKLNTGKNILTLKIPFGKRTNTEWCYILGNFNVKVEGCEKTIIAPTSKIGFSTVTNQGLPFYGGNITYKVPVETEKCTLSIKANHYRGSLIKVTIDGKKAGVIAYAPYTLFIENIEKGAHTIELTLYGNRYNSFAALHNTGSSKWFGPNGWRTAGDSWSYSYQLKDTGILSSPIIGIYE